MADFCDIAVVGAGAAGLATAIFARQHNPARSVVVIDGAKKPGAKILVSGGGRCNVTNVSVSDKDFWGGSRAIIRRVLRAFPVGETVNFFSRLGVPLHEEAGGKLFPDSNRSRDVLNALLTEAQRLGVVLDTDRRALDVVSDQSGFTIATSRGSLGAPRVVLATGGQALPKSGSDGAGYEIARRLGHTIVPTTPALAPLLLENRPRSLHQQLSGVAQDVELSVWVDGRVAVSLNGALLWTHFGVSGPAALDASRHWARAVLEGRSVAVTVNLCPAYRFDDIERRLLGLIAERPRAAARTLLATFLPASLADALIVAADIEPISPAGKLSREQRRRLTSYLVSYPLEVIDTRGYTYAEATAGGVCLNEVAASTLASRVCPGLYVVGEVLDVDGRLGGFNFQWAWSSGWVAGRAAATSA